MSVEGQAENAARSFHAAMFFFTLWRHYWSGGGARWPLTFVGLKYGMAALQHHGKNNGKRHIGTFCSIQLELSPQGLQFHC